MHFRTPRTNPDTSISETDLPESASTAMPVVTRRDLTATRRRVHRTRVIAASWAAATAIVAGTGFAAYSAADSPVSRALGLSSPSAMPSGVSVTHAGDGRESVHAGSAVSKATANTEAKLAIATAQQVARDAHGKVDATQLTTSLASLSDYPKLNPDTVLARVASTQTVAEQVGDATNAANSRIAAERATAAKNAAAAAAAKAAADQQAAANTPAGAQATAKALMASQYGWGADQFSCLSSLWTKESGWRYTAYNPSGATGIPQALPGSKMASVASDWSTNATTQVIWGLRYISGSYGTPCAAWSHSQASNWY